MDVIVEQEDGVGSGHLREVNVDAGRGPRGVTRKQSGELAVVLCSVFCTVQFMTWLASVSSSRLPSGTENRRYRAPPRPLLSTSSASPSGESFRWSVQCA